MKGKVYLVGAGPGDPGLVTLRAKQLIDEADFVLYDQLISPEVLQLIPHETEAQAVESLPGKHPDRFHAIYERMIEKAKAGLAVVRLKSGDPMIFGRVGEETEALRQASIPYEIVPGVTAALAAGAYLEIPLTHRLHSSLLTIVTGHESVEKGPSSLDWANLASNNGTLAFYMGVSKLDQIAKNLISHGKPSETPAAVIHRATWNRQRSVQGTLATIHDRVVEAKLQAPAILIVGPVVGLRDMEGWFEDKPLLGLRILVTRPAHQAEELGRLLREQGAEPIYHPLVEIGPPDSFEPLDLLIRQLNEPNSSDSPWLVFTSVNGVDGFMNRVRQLGYDLRVFGRTRLATIGKRTALALSKYGLKPDITTEEESNSEGLLGLLRDRVRGLKVYLCQAQEGRELLYEELSPLATVARIPIYQQLPITNGIAMPTDLDLVTLTSPQLCRLFLERCPNVLRERILDGQCQLAVNSQRSCAVLEEARLKVKYVSTRPEMAKLLEVIVEGRSYTPRGQK